MKLVSFLGPKGDTRIGALKDDCIVDFAVALAGGELLSGDMVELITRLEDLGGLEQLEAAIKKSPPGAMVEFRQARLLAPIPRPRKNIFCLGRNYAEHAAESHRAFGEGAKIEAPERPAHPAIFTKAPTTVIGPYQEIPYDPSVSEALDWEVELAVIIGRRGINIQRQDAMYHVFGYMVLNDISARDLQRRHGGQFFKGKSLDGSCPMGPWIVTADEIREPGNLNLRTLVNGTVKQEDNTGSMIWDIPAIIEELSLGMTLEPGDIIATGTPAGVGFARTPPEFLRPGDIVECEISGIGQIRNKVGSG